MDVHAALLLQILLCFPTAMGGNSEEVGDIIFRYEGTTLASKGTFHLLIHMDLATVENNLARAKNFSDYLGANFDVALEVRAQHKLRHDDAKETLAAIKSFGKSIRPPDHGADMQLTIRARRETANNETLIRDRRSPWALAARAITGGADLAVTLYGVYQKHQLTKMVDKTVKRVDDLYHMVDPINSRIKILETGTVRLQTQTDDLVETVQRLQLVDGAVALANGYWDNVEKQVADMWLTLTTLMTKRLNPRALRPGVMHEALLRAQEEAVNNGFQLLVENEAEAYQCEASFVIDADHGFIAILHLPLGKMDDQMLLYRFVGVPIPLDDGQHMFFHPTHDVVAVDKEDKFFQTMTLAHLTTCKKLASLYLCENTNLRTSTEVANNHDGEIDEQLCIWGLLRQKFDIIKSACKVHIRRPADRGYAISAQEYVFVARQPEQGSLECPNRVPDTFSVRGVARVKVAAGCTATTRFHTAFGDVDDRMHIKPIAWTWPRDPLELIASIDRQAWAKMPKRPLPSDRDELQDEIEDWKRDQEEDQQNGAIRAATIAAWVIIGLLLASSGIGCYYLREHQHYIIAKVRPFLVQQRAKISTKLGGTTADKVMVEQQKNDTESGVDSLGEGSD
jgi:hypothetical protein